MEATIWGLGYCSSGGRSTTGSRGTFAFKVWGFAGAVFANTREGVGFYVQSSPKP